MAMDGQAAGSHGLRCDLSGDPAAGVPGLGSRLAWVPGGGAGGLPVEVQAVAGPWAAITEELPTWATDGAE